MQPTQISHSRMNFWRGLQANPLVAYYFRRRHRLSAWWLIWLGVGLWLACFAAAILAFLTLLWGWRRLTVPVYATTPTESPLAMMAALAVAVVITTPPAIAWVTALFAAREVESGRHHLVCMTSLSDGEIVRGYLAVTLHRVRVQLALALGLTPALATLLADFPWGWSTYTPNFDRVMAQFTQWLVYLLATVLTVGIVNLLALVVGMNLGLRLGRVNLAMGSAPAAVFLGLLGWLMLLGIVGDSDFECLTLLLLLLPWLTTQVAVFMTGKIARQAAMARKG